jgi:hypothetical protein
MSDTQFEAVGALSFPFVSYPDQLRTHQLVKGCCSLAGIASKCESYQSPAFSVEINNAWSCNPTVSCPFKILFLMKERENFTLCERWLRPPL